MRSPTPVSPIQTEPSDRPGGLAGVVRAGKAAGRLIVVAWLLSALYHVVMFAVMAWIPWLAGLVRDGSEDVPKFTQVVGLVDETEITLSPSPQPTAQVTPTAFEEVTIEPEEFVPLNALAPAQPRSLDIIGVGTGGGDFDKYGFSAASKSPGPSFFGLGTQARGARRIVYVVDRSGSMTTTLHGVVAELIESIGKLRRTQRFHVIFFNSGMPIENPPKDLVAATPAHKRDAYRFFRTVVPGGSTDPRLAMRRAFAVEPDLVYFLTDGEFDKNLLSTLAKLNRRKKVRIFTIAYVSEAGAPLLEHIAREHNGEYRFVSENEIF